MSPAFNDNNIYFDRNEIGELEEDTIASFKNTVSTLFLGENDLGEIPPRFFRFLFTNHMMITYTRGLKHAAQEMTKSLILITFSLF